MSEFIPNIGEFFSTMAQMLGWSVFTLQITKDFVKKPQVHAFFFCYVVHGSLGSWG